MECWRKREPEEWFRRIHTQAHQWLSGVEGCSGSCSSSPFRVTAECLPRAHCHPQRQRCLCWSSMECFPSGFKRGECAKCCQGTWGLCVSDSWTGKVNQAFSFQLLCASLGVPGLQFLCSLGLPANEKQIWWKTAFPGRTVAKQKTAFPLQIWHVKPPHVLWDELKTFLQNKGEMRLKSPPLSQQCGGEAHLPGL